MNRLWYWVFFRLPLGWMIRSDVRWLNDVYLWVASNALSWEYEREERALTVAVAGEEQGEA